MRRAIVAVAAVGAAAALAACGSSGGGGGKKDLALIAGVKGDEFYITMKCGAQAEAAKKGVNLSFQGPDQFDASLRALDINLGHDTMSELDRIFPGPGGAAPEAYAW